MDSDKLEINDDIVAFKNELRNYTHYKRRVKAQQELIDLCEYNLGGVKGIRYDKLPGHSPPNKDVEEKLRKEIDKHTQLRDDTQKKIDDIDKILNLIEISLRNDLIEVYANNKTIEEVAKKEYISTTGLLYQFNKAIKKALEQIF